MLYSKRAIPEIEEKTFTQVTNTAFPSTIAQCIFNTTSMSKNENKV